MPGTHFGGIVDSFLPTERVSTKSGQADTTKPLSGNQLLRLLSQPGGIGFPERETFGGSSGPDSQRDPTTGWWPGRASLSPVLLGDDLPKDRYGVIFRHVGSQPVVMEHFDHPSVRAADAGDATWTAPTSQARADVTAAINQILDQ